jgi:hypothetical protein
MLVYVSLLWWPLSSMKTLLIYAWCLIQGLVAKDKFHVSYRGAKLNSSLSQVRLACLLNFLMSAIFSYLFTIPFYRCWLIVCVITSGGLTQMKTAIDCCVVHRLQATDYELQLVSSSYLWSPCSEISVCKQSKCGNMFPNALKLGLLMQFDILLSNLWPLGASIAVPLVSFHRGITLESIFTCRVWPVLHSIIHVHVKNKNQVTCVKI